MSTIRAAVFLLFFFRSYFAPGSQRILQFGKDELELLAFPLVTHGLFFSFQVWILVCFYCVRAAIVCLPIAQCLPYSHLSVVRCALRFTVPFWEFVKIVQMPFVAATF